MSKIFRQQPDSSAMIEYTRQQISSFATKAIRSLRNREPEPSFQTIADLINDFNEGSGGDVGLISRSTVEDLYSEDRAIHEKTLQRILPWLQSEFSWVFSPPMNHETSEAFQKFYGVDPYEVERLSRDIAGEFTAFRKVYREDFEGSGETTNDPRESQNKEWIISKMQFQPNGLNGTLEVRESFITKLTEVDKWRRYDWEGVCFPVGEYIHVFMRELQDGTMPANIKMMSLKTRRDISDRSIFEMYGHYTVTLTEAQHMRHTRVFMTSRQTKLGKDINPIHVDKIDDAICTRIKIGMGRVDDLAAEK